MKQQKSEPKPPLTAKLTFGRLPKVTLCWPTISPTIPLAMKNLNLYGKDPMTSVISLLMDPTS